MNAPVVQQTLFKDVVADLPDQHKAEFFRNLHEAGISPNDVELARLLRALQLYKAYYESIPAAVRAAVDEIERLKQEIERLTDDARESSDAGAQLAGKVIQEAKRVHQDLTEIHKHVEQAMRQSAQSLASHMAESLNAGIEQKVLQPFQSWLSALARSNQAMEDAITRSKQATAAMSQNVVLARRIHLWAYALGALIITCSLVLISWFYLHQSYAARIDEERANLVRQIEKNRAVFIKLAESHRTLDLVQDPEQPRRKLLVMKNASCWQSARNEGVIEFKD